MKNSYFRFLAKKPLRKNPRDSFRLTLSTNFEKKIGLGNLKKKFIKNSYFPFLP